MLPGLIALVAVLFVPGAVLARLAGIRGLLGLAGGPAISMAFFGVAGIGLDRLGLAWSWFGLIACFAAAGVLAASAGAWIRADARRRFRTGGTSRPAGLWAATYIRTPAPGWLTLAIAGSALVMAIPIALGMESPEALLQQWDAVFHTNGIAAIRETGNASTLGAMQPLFGAVGDGYYYPAVWHAILALAPGFSTIAASANASTVALSAQSGWSRLKIECTNARSIGRRLLAWNSGSFLRRCCASAWPRPGASHTSVMHRPGASRPGNCGRCISVPNGW